MVSICITLMSQMLFYKTVIQNGMNLYRSDVLDVFFMKQLYKMVSICIDLMSQMLLYKTLMSQMLLYKGLMSQMLFYKTLMSQMLFYKAVMYQMLFYKTVPSCIDLMSQVLSYTAETKTVIQNGINLYRFDVLDGVL